MAAPIPCTTREVISRPGSTARPPVGLFPRDLTLDQAAGQVLVGNFNSDTVEEFPVPTGP
jgi:hypothetical protein